MVKSLGTEPGSLNEELYFKCPKCGSLFSSTRGAMEEAKSTRIGITQFFLGDRLAPIPYVPKCTRCRTKLERISEEEFDKLMAQPR